MPGWVKALLDDWLQAANLTAGKLFRRVKNGRAWGDGLTEKAVWRVVREYAPQSPHREACASRSQEEMCPAVSRGGWRTGTDSVPPRARLNSNDRAIPRLQAAHSIRR